MSHALGDVIKDHRIVGAFVYNGTADVAYPRIFASGSEAAHYWSGETAGAECKCQNTPDDVVLFAHYGRGLYWNAKACLKCGAITDNRSLELMEDSGVFPVHGRPPRLKAPH